MLNPPLSYKH